MEINRHERLRRGVPSSRPLAQKVPEEGMHLSIHSFMPLHAPAESAAPSQASLAEAFAAASPRVTGTERAWSSTAIHLGVLASWVVLCAAAFGAQGLLVWSIGLFYIAYDLFLQCLMLGAAWRLARPSSSAPVVSLVSKRVGVIVAAHNEALVLPATISGLLSQSRPPDLIVIADDGSSDGTAPLLSTQYGLAAPEFGTCSRASSAIASLRWLRLPHGGKAKALNEAIVQMDDEGIDIVLTVDADTLLDKGALAAMVQAFVRDPDLVAATGVLMPVCQPGWQGRWLQWFQTYEYMRNFLSRYAWMRLNGLLLISGAFAAFRRQALLDVGGFDADCLVEDYELIHRMRRYSARRRLNWTTAVVGQAKAWTDAPAGVLAFLRQRRRWFGGFLQTQYWYRDMVGQARYGEVGTRMLPIKAMDTLQPWFGLTSVLVVLACLVRGQWDVLWPAMGVLGIKALFDLACHAWSAVLYRRWTGERGGVQVWGAVVAALIEPWTFQFLRQAGALWGWLHFLRGRQRWDASVRGRLVAQRNTLR
jgi:cellulose synthase/poly-beta-1,6-N-acetylglucosamine synthase-like glycosyltransferase